MGDLRNKIRKQIETEQHQAYLRLRFPPKPPPPPIRCQCGFRSDQVPVMWGIQRDDFWRTTTYHCPACLPPEYLADVVMDAANLPD